MVYKESQEYLNILQDIFLKHVIRQPISDIVNQIWYYLSNKMNQRLATKKISATTAESGIYEIRSRPQL